MRFTRVREIGVWLTYREVDFGSGGAFWQRLSVTVGGGVVDLGQGEAIFAVVDREAGERVGQLGNRVKKRLVSGLEEGAVPGTSSTRKLMRFL